MKKRQDTYIQVPLFLFRDAHIKFESFVAKCIAYAAYHKSPTNNIAEGLELIKQEPQSQEVLSGLKIEAEKINKQYEKEKTIKGADYPMPNIKLELLLKLLDEKPTKKRIMDYMAYLSVQSILGKRYRYLLTNNNHVLARMLGYASHKEIQSIGVDNLEPHLKERFDYFYRPNGEFSKYKMVRMFDRLIDNWNVHKGGNSGTEGYYISTEAKMSQDQFTDMLDTLDKKKTKSQQLKEKIKQKKEQEIFQAF